MTTALVDITARPLELELTALELEEAITALLDRQELVDEDAGARLERARRRLELELGERLAA